MIEVTQRGAVTVLELAHGKANALDIELCQALIDHIREAEASSARAVVLTGRGKIFSAGVDLLRAGSGGVEYLRRFLPVLDQAFEALFLSRTPVVAAVNGHAIAGGCVLACAADRRLMARDGGRIGVTELLVGVPFPAVALEIMRAGSAPERFQEVVYSGATFTAADALARGLVEEVVDPDALRRRALAVAEALAAVPPATFRLTKEQVRAPALERLRRDGARFDRAVQDIWLAPGTIEAMQAYVARTFKKPVA